MALQVRESLDDGATLDEEAYPANAERTLNPSLGAVFRAGDRVSLRAAAYRGFRAPTLRELYHVASTRGGVVLVNNPLLEPERLVGFEAGVDIGLGTAADLRLTVFRNTVEDLVQNITRGSTGDAPGIVEPCGLLAPNETCRELDNVGEMRASGLELEAELRPAPDWSLFLSYLYNTTEITRAPDNPALVAAEVKGVRVFRGYAGWGPGQLEGEMRANAWLSVAAYTDIVFDLPLPNRFNEALGKLGIKIDRLHSEAGNA